MNIETPKSWHKGQTIFNFLWWLNEKKGYAPEYLMDGYANTRMADPFYIEDKLFDKLYQEFLKSPNI